jgi:hypothetical protein
MQEAMLLQQLEARSTADILLAMSCSAPAPPPQIILDGKGKENERTLGSGLASGLCQESNENAVAHAHKHNIALPSTFAILSEQMASDDDETSSETSYHMLHSDDSKPMGKSKHFIRWKEGSIRLEDGEEIKLCPEEMETLRWVLMDIRVRSWPPVSMCANQYVMQRR